MPLKRLVEFERVTLAAGTATWSSMFPIFLPHFRLYEVLSLHVCVLLYTCRKILPNFAQIEGAWDAAGASTTVALTVKRSQLAITTADGTTKVYPGTHELVFSRGNGVDSTVPVTV